MVSNLEALKLLDDIPWLAAIGALLLVPLLDFNVNLLIPILTDALFLLVLGLELCQATRSSLYGGGRAARGWVLAGWMGVTWGAYQLIGIFDMGLAPFQGVLTLVLLGLAVQYFGKTEFVSLPEIGTVSTPLLILAAFTFISLIVNTSLVTGAIFLTAAGYLVSDENAYAGYMAPLGALLAGYAVIIL